MPSCLRGGVRSAREGDWHPPSGFWLRGLSKHLAGADPSGGIEFAPGPCPIRHRARTSRVLAASGLSIESLEQKCLRQVTNVALADDLLELVTEIAQPLHIEKSRLPSHRIISDPSVTMESEKQRIGEVLKSIQVLTPCTDLRVDRVRPFTTLAASIRRDRAMIERALYIPNQGRDRGPRHACSAIPSAASPSRHAARSS
jgi:hypothetical protein